MMRGETKSAQRGSCTFAVLSFEAVMKYVRSGEN